MIDCLSFGGDFAFLKGSLSVLYIFKLVTVLPNKTYLLLIESTFRQPVNFDSKISLHTTCKNAKKGYFLLTLLAIALQTINLKHRRREKGTRVEKKACPALKSGL